MQSKIKTNSINQQKLKIMGLDIYAHKVEKSVIDKYNVSFDNTIDEIKDALDKEAVAEFDKKTAKLLKQLRKDYANSDKNYSEVYLKFIDKLRRAIRIYKTYSFKLAPLGFTNFGRDFSETKTPDEVEEVFKQEREHHYSLHQAYFRKVNFIYEYFRGKLEDECCKATKQDIEDLINTCKDVLAHKGDKEYAELYLPTTAGFFFGSTEYDKWYWEDVKDCKKQMEKIYKSLKDDDDFVLWIFSW